MVGPEGKTTMAAKAFSPEFYSHVFTSIQLFNETEPDISGIEWFEAILQTCKKMDKDYYGEFQDRDLKKVASFVSRVKTIMVNDIAEANQLSANQKKALSKKIKLPSRSATDEMLRKASSDSAYQSFAQHIVKGL